MPPVNTKEKMALHLVSQPSDLSTAGVKDKELFIHNTLRRGSTDRATVEGREEGRGQKKERGQERETRGTREKVERMKRGREKEGQGRERKRERE